MLAVIDPLVPAHVDLRDFEFMPLKVVRLRDSDLVTYSTGDEFKAAVLLWAAAWHQVPAGTLPTDDRWLAKHSGAGLGWRKIKAGALRGWLEATDGRLHHEVVAEVANSSWRKKQEQRAQTLRARIAGIEKRLAQAVTTSDRAQLQTTLQILSHEMSQHLSQAVSQHKSSAVTSRTPSVTDTVTTSKRSEVKGSIKTKVEETPTPEAGNLAATPLGDSSPEKQTPKTNGSAEWWNTPESVLAHGKDVGIPPKPQESNSEYKARLFKAEYPTRPIP